MEIAKKVKKMNEPIQYPLNAAQMKKIVNEQAKKNIEAIRLKKMMTSIYDYKSKINYENKMKIVRNVTQK